MNVSLAVSTINITDKERDIINLLAEGYTYKDIAQITASKAGTVRASIEKIRLKLRARNIPHAIFLAFQAGVLKVNHEAE